MKVDSVQPSYRSVLMVMAGTTLLGMLAYSGPLGHAVTVYTELDSSAAGVAWVISSMSVGLAVGLLAAGIVADRIGKSRVFLLGLVIFILANMLGALANSVTLFVISRILVGLGATGMIATGLGLVSRVATTPRQRASTATWWSISMGLGNTTGPLIAGALDLIDAWRVFYLILAVFGLAVWAVARRIVPGDELAPSTERRPFDLLGFVLLLGFLVLFITAIVEVRSGRTTATIALFVAAGATLAALLASQQYGQRRLVDLSLITHRPFQASVVAALGMGLSVIGVIGITATYLASDLGMPTIQAGLASATWSAASTLAPLLLAPFVGRVSSARLVVIGLIGGGLGLLPALEVSATGDYGRLLLGYVVSGFAVGILNIGLARQAVETVPARDVATGTAASNTARYLGGAIGMSVASVIVVGNSVAGWNVAVWGGAVAAVVAAALVVALSLPRTRTGGD